MFNFSYRGGREAGLYISKSDFWCKVNLATRNNIHKTIEDYNTDGILRRKIQDIVPELLIIESWKYDMGTYV